MNTTLGGEKFNLGYTIVEVLIFLAISGSMFVMAATFVSGKQASAEFKQGMNGLNSQVQQVINDVVNGFYPSNNNFSCTSSTTAGTPPVPNPHVSANQGQNKGCVFSGKIMQFAADGKSSSYNVFSVAGRQNISGVNSGAPTNFSQSVPRVFHSQVNLTVPKETEFGLEVTGMRDGAGDSVGAVGFFGSFNPSGQGGSQTVTAVVIPHVAFAQSALALESAFNAPTEPSDLDTEAAKGNIDVTICLRGGIRQFGSLIIGGGSGQRLTTTIKMGNSPGEVGC